jgi:hypothetical protein
MSVDYLDNMIEQRDSGRNIYIAFLTLPEDCIPPRLLCRSDAVSLSRRLGKLLSDTEGRHFVDLPPDLQQWLTEPKCERSILVTLRYELLRVLAEGRAARRQ